MPLEELHFRYNHTVRLKNGNTNYGNAHRKKEKKTYTQRKNTEENSGSWPLSSRVPPAAFPRCEDRFRLQCLPGTRDPGFALRPNNPDMAEPGSAQGHLPSATAQTEAAQTAVCSPGEGHGHAATAQVCDADASGQVSLMTRSQRKMREYLQPTYLAFSEIKEGMYVLQQSRIL